MAPHRHVRGRDDKSRPPRLVVREIPRVISSDSSLLRLRCFASVQGRAVLSALTSPGHTLSNAAVSDSRNSSPRLRPIHSFRVTSATTPRAGMRSTHADMRCRRSVSPLRRRPRSATHDGAILAGARCEPRPLPIGLRRPHSRTGPSTGRGGLLWPPPRNVRPAFVCGRSRQRVHRAPRSPSRASTSVRLRDSAARTCAAKRRRALSRSQPLTKLRRHESWHRQSWHARRRDPSM